MGKPTPEHHKHDDPEQSKRFEDTAREYGVDESDDDFEEAMRRIAPKSRRPPRQNERQSSS